MTTKAKATKKVISMLGDKAGEYNVGAIVEHLHDYIGSYDFTDIDQTNVDATAEEYPDDSLAEVHQVNEDLQAASREVTQLVQKRAKAIEKALDSGHTQQAIGLKLGVKQPRVAYMLKQGERIKG